ncbi:hypothetical protein K402DRAFT_382388 [Aulographum hederae CBS 113979]|uniref:Oxidoreductase-like domain-containing protein n=1 Tax=Aulographum hederae CBS 113979 TaxID=1176131 RepID=A0A6G1GSD0_9PEZI|nr:hypothetical protein K402DRAFT_382388 [Aulographum hederae CBS 113979]
MQQFAKRVRLETPSGYICQSCRRSISLRASRERRIPKLVGQQRRYKSDSGTSKQAQPLTGYYAELLSHPLHQTAPATRTTPAPPSASEPPTTKQDEVVNKARIVFGSRLAGPSERRKAKDDKSTYVAGVQIPPRPEEPDNCCMSGCVNCVWDLFRDDLEEWAAKSNEARAKILEKQRAGSATGTMAAAPGTPTHVATSMDDDGGGSETNWSMETPPSGDLFGNIPVGIREFMKTEKMLKMKHGAEGTTG